MKKAVVYARYSSDSQSEQSIDGQLRVCKEYAERENIKIVDTYIDRAMTGTNDHRPDFQRMLRDSKKKGFDYVLVYKFDRFARSRHDSAVNKAILNRNGVKVISATEQISDTPEGIILEGMLESFAEYYSAELSQKVKRGRKESANSFYFVRQTCLWKMQSKYDWRQRNRKKWHSLLLQMCEQKKKTLLRQKEC